MITTTAPNHLHPILAHIYNHICNNYQTQLTQVFGISPNSPHFYQEAILFVKQHLSTDGHFHALILNLYPDQARISIECTQPSRFAGIINYNLNDPHSLDKLTTEFKKQLDTHATCPCITKFKKQPNQEHPQT